MRGLWCSPRQTWCVALHLVVKTEKRLHLYALCGEKDGAWWCYPCQNAGMQRVPYSWTQLDGH